MSQQDSPFLSSSSSNSSLAANDFDPNDTKRRNKGLRRRRSSDVQSNRGSSKERKSHSRNPSHASSSERSQKNRRRAHSEESHRSLRRSRSRDRVDYRNPERSEHNQGTRPPYENSHHRRDQRRQRPARDGSVQENGIFIPSLSRPLVLYQQFASMQTRHISNLPSAYEKYKEDHQHNHAKAFLREHEFEQWFLEKYEPLTLFSMKKEVHEAACEVNPQDPYIDVNQWTLCVKNVPVWVSRSQLKEATRCTKVYCSEPLRMYNFERICWIRFSNQADYQNSLEEELQIKGEQGENFRCMPQKSSLINKEIEPTPSLPNEKIDRDMKLAEALMKIFDAEIGRSSPQVELKGGESLDFLVKYLRKVHGYCLYTGVRCEDERLLAIKTVRGYTRAVGTDEARSTESLEFEATYVKAAETFIQNGAQMLQSPHEDDELTELKNQFCAENVQEIQEGEKYRCAICEKGFRGAEFVQKHIQFKHEDKMEKKFVQGLFKTKARNAYLADSHKIENPPISHSFSKYNDSYWATRGGNGAGSARTPYESKQRPATKPRDETEAGQTEAVPKREYIDYDDPMSGAVAASSGNVAKQTQQLVINKQTRQMVSYDDLF